MIRKLLKDVVISLVIGIGKGAFRHILSKAEAVSAAPTGSSANTLGTG